MVHRVTTNDSEWYNEWQRMTMSGATSDNEWYQWQRVVQWVTTNDNEWQQVTATGTTSDKEWQRVIQGVTASENKCQWVIASSSSGTTNENSTVNDSCAFNEEKRYTTTSRDEWLQLEWLNK